MLDLDTITKLFNASPTASMILHPDSPSFRVGWVNPSCINLLGRAVKDTIGLSIYNVFQDFTEDSILNQTLQNALLHALNKKEASNTRLQLFKTGKEAFADEKTFHLIASTYPLFDQEENVTFIVLNLGESTRDAPESAENLEQLQEMQGKAEQSSAYHNRIYSMFESITDGFFAIDKACRITYWNKEAEQILQRPTSSVLGAYLWDVYPEHADSAFRSAYETFNSEKTSVNLERYMPALNLWLEISAYPSDEGLCFYFKNITERKKEEANLRKAKQQYQQFFQLSPLPQLVYGIDDLFIKDVNQAAIDHYQYSKEDFLSMTIMDIGPEEDTPMVEQLVKEKLRKGLYHNGIFRHLKKSGEIIDVQVVGRSIDLEGERARLVLALDITEKLSTQKALKASEERFKALIQDGSDLIAILNATGDYLYVNQASERILGIQLEDFIGKNAFDFIHEGDKERVITEFSQLAHQKSIKISAFKFIDSEGQYRWIETIVTNMLDDPSVSGIVANSRDVTERIKNEIKIQQSVERYNIVSKATSDAIWDLDVSTGLMVWNKALKGLFGYKETDSTRNWWEERVHPSDLERVSKKMIEVFHGKKARMKMEYRFRCADNTYKSVLDRAFLVYNDAGELIRVIGSMEDITERQVYIQTVEAQNKRLHEIAWTQSHVVRAPLTNIMGIADLLSYGVDDAETLSELTTHLLNAAADLDAVIKDIVKKTDELNLPPSL